MKMTITFDIAPEEATALMKQWREFSKEDREMFAKENPFPLHSMPPMPVEYYEGDEIPKNWKGYRVDFKNTLEAPASFNQFENLFVSDDDGEAIKIRNSDDIIRGKHKLKVRKSKTFKS